MEREQATKFIYDLLRALVAKKGSDLFITSGFPPAMKIDSKMTPVSQTALTAQHTAMLCRAVMNDKQAAEFEAKKECNFAINPAGIPVALILIVWEVVSLKQRKKALRQQQQQEQHRSSSVTPSVLTGSANETTS